MDEEKYSREENEEVDVLEDKYNKVLEEYFRLQESINTRKEMKIKIIENFNEIILSIKTQMNRLDVLPDTEDSLKRKTELEDSIVKISMAIMQEKRDSFRDIMNLQKELSQLVLNYGTILSGCLKSDV